MKLIKTLLVLLLTLIIIQVQPYIYIVATGSGGDDVDGSFESVGYNNPVELQGFELLDQNMNAVYALNPRDVYTVRLTLHDEDSIADIKQLSLVFYYGSAPTSDLSGLINTGTTTDGTAFVANWERDPVSFDPFDAPAPASFNISSSAASSDYSWDIISSTTPAILADFDEELSTKTFTFELSFKVSKVAPQTSDGEWRFGVVVTDGLFPNESELDQLTSSALKIVSSGNPLSGQGTLFNMNWYGEVSIDQAMQINWTDVVPPLDFGGNNSLATTASITFISNGTYERATAASNIWDIVNSHGDPVLAADGSTMAALQADALTAAQTFGLVAAIEGDQTFNISRNESRLSPTSDSVTQYTILGGKSRTTEAGNDYVFEYYLALSSFFQNAIYKGSIEIKINNSLSVAMIGQETYNTLAEAASAANEGNSIKLLSNTEENVFLTTAASIDFNGFTLKGDLDVAFEGETTMTFSGLGILDGDLIIDAPDLTLDTDLTVLGETTIIAIGSSSLNTSGVHKGGISVEGPARINALNESVRPMVTINTTAAIVVDGFVDEVSINVDDVVITVNAAINRLITNNRPSTITLSEDASANIQNMVKNSSTNAVFDSIQAAIDAAVDGDTIEVGPGTYYESLYIGDIENITLKSSNGAEVTIIDVDGAENGIALGTITQGKSYNPNGEYPNNITIQGFTIMNWDERGIAQRNGTGSMFIYDNIVIPPSNPAGPNRGAIILSGGDGSRVVGNTVSAPPFGDPNWSSAVILLIGSMNTLIEDNTILGSGAKYGIGVFGYPDYVNLDPSWVSSENNIIRNNTIENVELGIGFGGQALNNTAENNTITAINSGFFEGFQVGGMPSGNVVINNDISLASVAGIELSDNLNAEGYVTPMSITSNTFSDMDVYLIDGSEKLNLESIKTANTFLDEGAALVVDENRLGRPSTIPIINTTLQKGYTTIQGAIDSASNGDTVEVGSGVYDETLIVNKPVTLSGVNAGLLLGDTREPEAVISGGSIKITSENVTLDGFKFLNTFFEMFDLDNSSVISSVIEHEYVLEQYFTMPFADSGNRYILKGRGGVEGLNFKNLMIMGPGKDALATSSSVSIISEAGLSPSAFYIGGIDFNSVINSTIKNVSIEDVSRYAVILVNTGQGENSITTSGITIENLTVKNSGHSESTFMAALAFFNQPTDITLKGTLDFDTVPLGMDIRSLLQSETNLEDFDLVITNAGIDLLGIGAEDFSDDALAIELGAVVRFEQALYYLNEDELRDSFLVNVHDLTKETLSDRE